MKIGILQRQDIRNIKTLSGVPSFMAKALREHVGDVAYLCPDKSLLSNFIEISGRALNRGTYSLFHRRIAPDHNRLLSKSSARDFQSRIWKSGCDVIFAPLASVEIACLETRVPIVYVSDMNWADIVDYYPGFTSLFSFAKAEGERVAAAAIARAEALIYPSAWAAHTARTHYGAPAEKIHIVPYGANLEQVPSQEAALSHELRETVELLWIGVDWERKGGPVALECLRVLVANGIKARLTVCGCIPPQHSEGTQVHAIPFLNKSIPADRERFSRLYLDAHVFLFPTRAEAFGVVLSEACAHGLPTLARNTGGVSSAIIDGENGFLLPPDASGADYAEKIMRMIQNPLEYHKLVCASRDAYEERLNWDSWGRSVKPIFEGVLARHANPLEIR